jgi:tetratricopeptide (TPR) repeat protein
MLRSVVFPFRYLRRHPWASGTALLVLLAASVAGVNGWAWYHYRAAANALRVDEMEAARQHIDQCLRVWRYDAATQFLAARIERVSGHTPQAEEHLRECVRLQHGPSDRTQLEEVLLRAQTSEFDEVEAGLWQCVDQNHPEKARVLETLARVYMRDSRLRAAQHCLTLWLEMEPDMARAWHWRGWVRERLMQPEKALADYEKSLEVEPDRWGVRMRLVRLHLERNNAEAARPHLDELMRRHGDELDVRIAQARCLFIEGENAQASALLDGVLESHPKNFEALYYRGFLALQADPSRDAEAESYLIRALAERPADIHALHSYHQALEHQGKKREAALVEKKTKQAEKDTQRLVELWNREIERAPHNADMLSEIGELMLKLGDDTGVTWLRRALNEDQSHKRSLEILVRHYESTGNKAEADMYRQHLQRLTGASAAAPTPRN